MCRGRVWVCVCRGRVCVCVEGGCVCVYVCRGRVCVWSISHFLLRLLHSTVLTYSKLSRKTTGSTVETNARIAYLWRSTVSCGCLQNVCTRHLTTSESVTHTHTHIHTHPHIHVHTHTRCSTIGGVMYATREIQEWTVQTSQVLGITRRCIRSVAHLLILPVVLL